MLFGDVSRSHVIGLAGLRALKDGSRRNGADTFDAGGPMLSIEANGGVVELELPLNVATSVSTVPARERMPERASEQAEAILSIVLDDAQDRGTQLAGRSNTAKDSLFSIRSTLSSSKASLELCGASNTH